jgi:DNA-binding MarR family transcriptional regulator
MTDEYDCLKLENQICFPLYACSKEIVRRYRPMLDALDLTYTQYITMMALWEYGESSVADLGKRLYLDSGTLTPLLKNLESKGYISRERSASDERVVIVTVTPEGMKLRDDAVKVPGMISSCIQMEPEDAKKLYELLYKVLAQLQ